MASASTILTQFAVAEGDELLSVFMAHLRRLYSEVYGTTVYLGQAPERREFPIGEGEGLRVGTSIINSSKLGAYTGRFNHLNLSVMNNPSSNLTTVYLDTPLVGPTLDPLE